MSVADVLDGREKWSIEKANCLAWLDQLPTASVDLFVFSPPYEVARTYGEVGFNLKGQAWVDWMAKVFRGALRACKGVVVCVCEGQTKDFRWSAAPVLLMADLVRAGVTLRKPPIYQRIGIPGSGGPDWLRNDYEFCICATAGGKLPWSDNTACGHAPKWAPGGAMSHRLTDGTRRNQWGKDGGHGCRRKDGSRDMSVRPSHKTTRGHKGGDVIDGEYSPPAIANPGNIIACNVGGNQMGDKKASENEAPYPEKVPEIFVRSFCPPDGIVADCFSGSGTTGKVAIAWGRRFIGCDLRESQVKLTRRRLLATTPTMFPDSSPSCSGCGKRTLESPCAECMNGAPS